MIALLAAAMLQAAEPPSAADQLQELETLYAQSCGVRAYAQYDDICDDLDSRLRQLRAKAAREARRRPPPATSGQAAHVADETAPPPQPRPPAAPALAGAPPAPHS